MPSENHFIPLARPCLGAEETQEIHRVIESGWVSQGPEVAAFEEDFAKYCGSAFACAVSSCTTALHLALLAVGVKPGDEVITVSHSFIATTSAIHYCGATPVFVDIQPDTFNINPLLIREAISKKTRAILCVHQMGMPCDLEAIVNLGQEFKLPVIEDAACAIGSEILSEGNWQKIGRPHGDIACFSFHPRKVITTGDGGMLTTNNKQLDQQFRLLRQHGMSIPDTVRHTSQEVIFEEYPVIGFNYRLTDIQAAMGRIQLQRLPDIIKQRQAVAQRYHALLTEIPGIKCPHEPPWVRSNWQSYCVGLPDRCNQKKIMQDMLIQQIATRRGIMCSHLEHAYDGTNSRQAGDLLISKQARDHSIILPLYPQMTEQEQDRVVLALGQACKPE